MFLFTEVIKNCNETEQQYQDENEDILDRINKALSSMPEDISDGEEIADAGYLDKNRDEIIQPPTEASEENADEGSKTVDEESVAELEPPTENISNESLHNDQQGTLPPSQEAYSLSVLMDNTISVTDEEKLYPLRSLLVYKTNPDGSDNTGKNMKNEDNFLIFILRDEDS